VIPSQPSVFRLDQAVAEAVRQHNECWSRRRECLFGRLPPPRWDRTLPLDAEWRMLYESYLPVAEFAASLRRLGRLVLPHPAWIPAVLAETGRHLASRCLFPSLPDLWSYLPPAWCGRVTLTVAELPALFAALADPSRFGTAAGRYPDQLARLRDWAAGWPGELTLLDVGCGTGEGTWETLAMLLGMGCRARAIGVTREPLEAWMAANGCFPHRPAEPPPPALPGLHFLAGDATALPLRGHFSVILCNGLVGGQFLRTDSAFQSLLAEFARLLGPGGVVLAGCRFHAGREAALTRFRELAETAGWQVAGDCRDLVLRLPNR
jgi:SAM-dependent methyltransferase